LLNAGPFECGFDVTSDGADLVRAHSGRVPRSP
jgi:hypothetical protein